MMPSPWALYFEHVTVQNFARILFDEPEMLIPLFFFVTAPGLAFLIPVKLCLCKDWSLNVRRLVPNHGTNLLI